jgi:quinol-cytochrome oxidoreductase complex cytochrome b subunit
VTPTHIVPEWYEREVYRALFRVEMFVFRNKISRT